MGFDEKRNVLLCWLQLLKNINSQLLSQWWSKETQTRIVAFFQVLTSLH
jgi:hypothetical protein